MRAKGGEGGREGGVLGESEGGVPTHAGEFEDGEKLEGAGERAEGAAGTSSFCSGVFKYRPETVNPWTTLVLLLSWLLLYLLLLLLFAADLSSLLLPAAAIIVAAAAATIALISTTHRAKQIINHGMRAIMMVPMPFPRGRREGSRKQQTA